MSSRQSVMENVVTRLRKRKIQKEQAKKRRAKSKQAREKALQEEVSSRDRVTKDMGLATRLKQEATVKRAKATQKVKSAANNARRAAVPVVVAGSLAAGAYGINKISQQNKAHLDKSAPHQIEARFEKFKNFNLTLPKHEKMSFPRTWSEIAGKYGLYPTIYAKHKKIVKFVNRLSMELNETPDLTMQRLEKYSPEKIKQAERNLNNARKRALKNKKGKAPKPLDSEQLDNTLRQIYRAKSKRAR